MSTDVYLNFVGGQWKQGSSGQWDVNRNPARPTEILGKATRSTGVDLDRAIEAALAAQAEWAARPRPARGLVLDKAAAILRNKSESFSKLLNQESGKPLAECRQELGRAIAALRFLASEGARPTGEVYAAETGSGSVLTARAPLGAVAVITGSWEPVFQPATRIASALLEGNPVVFKPSSLAPASAALLARIFEEAGLPAGSLNLAYGGGPTLGQALIQDKRVAAVSFHGSSLNAREVCAQVSRRYGRVQADAQVPGTWVVLADADLELAALSTIRSGLGGRVIVEASVQAELLSLLVTGARGLRLESLSPLSDEKRLTGALEAIESARKEGAELLCGGERACGTAPEQGWYLAPTILAGVTPGMALAREDFPGPLLTVLAVDSVDAGLELARGRTRIYSRDPSRAQAAARAARAREVLVNSGDDASIDSPALIRESLRFFSELKAISTA